MTFEFRFIDGRAKNSEQIETEIQKILAELEGRVYLGSDGGLELDGFLDQIEIKNTSSRVLKRLQEFIERDVLVSGKSCKIVAEKDKSTGDENNNSWNIFHVYLELS